MDDRHRPEGDRLAPKPETENPKNPKEGGAGTFNPQRELLKARLRELFREPGILFWVFGFPLLMALCLGIAFRSKAPEIPAVAIVLADGGDEKLAQALERSERLDARTLPQKQALDDLAHARVDVIVELSRGGAQYRFDPMQGKAPLAKLVADDVLQEAAGRKDPVPTEERTHQEKGSRYIDFLIPGLIGLNIMGSSMWSIGFNLVVARKRKLLRRYAVTPMRRSQFLLAYFYTRLLALVLELGLLVAFGYFLFDTVIQGSALALVLVSALGAASFAGISLTIGARLENSETASGWMNLVQLPMWVLSGTFFSYERFPDVVHPLIELLPLTALVNGLRAIYNDGAGVLQLGPELIVLTIWGAAGYLVALRTFRWQ